MQVIVSLRNRAIRPKQITIILLILTPALFHLIPAQGIENSGSVRYALRDDGSVYRSLSGSAWDEIPEGLPDEIESLHIYAYQADKKYAYLTTGAQGLFRFDSSSERWRNISSPLFKTRTICNRPQSFRKISAFAIDQQMPSHIICATKHSIYESFDSGESWRLLSRPGISARNYITSLALNGKKILVGTSFAGIFLSTGEAFKDINIGLPFEPYSSTVRFYDEISSLCIDLQKNSDYYAGFASGRGVYSFRNGISWKEEFKPELKTRFSRVDSVSVYAGTGLTSISGTLYQKKSGIWIPAEKNREDMPFSRSSLSGLLYVDGKQKQACYYKSFITHSSNNSYPKALDKRAIYAGVPSVRAKLDSLIKTIKNCGFNAIVIDMKDDFGCIYFPTENTTAVDIGSAKKPLKITAILSKLKSNGIYTIARIVVFKDRELYRAYNGQYAIKDRKTGLPWKGTKGEFWVDPHSMFVHKYNIDLAIELENIGFDEIQFDYIRFPSDGPIDRCIYPSSKFSDSYKSEILADFLYSARAKLSKPLSTDIYGFNSWYRFGNTIGQDMEEFARYVDVICPMVYPSHFGTRFYSAFKGDDKSYQLIYDGGKRAHTIAGNVIIRPYLQAFKLLSPNWGPGYITSQRKGAAESGCSGFTYWNASGTYDILRDSFGGK